jgi:cysteine desulfurase
VIQPVRSLAAAAHDAGARVHVDLVQAAGKCPIALHDYPIAFASLSAHKLHGPKGVGALYVRTGTACSPYLTGGAQEDYRRAGTENVAGIIGFGKAAELAVQAAETYARLAMLRERFVNALSAAGVEVSINGAAAPRLPHVLNMRVPGVPAESLFLLLEPAGLLCATGSACTSAEPHPSHVLLAIGRVHDVAHGSLRLSLGEDITDEEVDYLIQSTKEVVEYLRSFSPVWRDLMAGKTPFILP